MRHCAETQARRLLRLLFLWHRGLPANSSRGCLLHLSDYTSVQRTDSLSADHSETQRISPWTWTYRPKCTKYDAMKSYDSAGRARTDPDA